MSAEAADLIVLAKRCHTWGPERAHASCMAVAGGRIVRLGGRRAVLRLRGRRTRVLEPRDAVVTPGLVDCHTHLFYWALMRALVTDVSKAGTLAAALASLAKGSEKRRVGDWVLGAGFDCNRWEAPPTARDLDRAVPERPAIVYSRDWHTAWLNTAALRRVGITARTIDPRGGRIVRDGRGRPTGVLEEMAVELLPDPLRELGRRNDDEARRVIDRALRAAYRVAWKNGITGVHSMDDGASLGHLRRHQVDGKLGLRVVHAIQLADMEQAWRLGLSSGFGDEWLRIGGIKMFADGALGSQTAYMFDPYPGRGQYRGLPIVAGEELAANVARAARHGFASWIHAIGDRAVHDAVMAIRAARRVGRPAVPQRIEHVQCARPADVRRMARAGIVASVQPCHLLGDIATADRHWPRARRHAYAFRRMLGAGVTLACGSDVPIESIDPRRSLFAATMRTDDKGRPDGGWFADQRLTAAEVLHAFTRGAAEASGASLPAGTLAVGGPADMTIWAEDPLRASPKNLLKIGILGCVIDGQVHLTGQ